MNILIVGSLYEQMSDLLHVSYLNDASLTSVSTENSVHELWNGGCDLCLVACADLDDAMLSAAEATAIPVVLLLGSAAELDEITASRHRQLPRDILSLADLTPLALTLAIRSVLLHAEDRRKANDIAVLFQSTQEAADTGTWDWDLATGKVTWSENLYRLFGVAPGGASQDLFQVWQDAIHPDDKAEAMSAATAAIASHRPLSSMFRIRKADADVASSEWRWISCKGRVLRDRSGAVTRLIGINIDITAQKQQEEAILTDRRVIKNNLLQTESIFRTFFDSSSDCKFRLRVREDGRFTYADVNAAGLAATGLTLEQMIGREPLELLGQEKGMEMTEGLREVLRTGRPFRYEPTWELETGTIVYDAVYMPLRDDAGVITDIVGVARDVTETRQTEAALLQAQKVEAIGHLASGVAHDFNNILSAFQACLRLVDREITSDRGRMVVAEGQSAVERGKALTEWLMGFIRKTPVTLTSIDANDALEQMGGMLRQALPPATVLKQELASDLDLARADTHEMALAVLNLAVNARDAMPQGGTLCIRTRNETVSQEQPDGIGSGRYVVVEIEDTGIGMSPKTMARALEPFFTTKSVGRGTGLGLSMVYGILRRTGGGLRISSHEGQGTRVSLYFPAVERDVQGDKEHACQNA